MPKKFLWGAGFVVVAVAVVAAAIWGGGRLLEASSNSISTRPQACKQTGVQHEAIIKDDAINPTTITGNRCDTLKIVNTDDVTREIGFGNHDHHVAYDGVAERLLTKDQSFTVTLNQTGEYHFHDHFHDEVAATFVVL